MNADFTKEHTLISKGIAILLMLYHHLYVVPERISCEYFSLIDTIIPGGQMILATFSKICVCIYVFLSGYGLYFSLKDETNILHSYKKVAFRALKFMTTFFIIFLLFVPIGMFTGYFEFNIKLLIGSIFGLYIGTYNNTWWFVNAYIVLLFLSPIFVYFVSKEKLLKRVLALLSIPTIYIIIKIYIKLIGTNIFVDHYFWHLESIQLILPLFVGILCARFNVYKSFISIFSKIKKDKLRSVVLYITLTIIMITSILFRIFVTRSIVDMRFDFIVVPLFVFSTSTLIYHSKIKKVLVLFGEHSTNIWLTHAFLCYTYFQSLVFLPYYSELVFLWFIILSLFTSYIVNLIITPINNLLYSKEHRLSYNGYLTFIKHKKTKEKGLK